MGLRSKNTTITGKKLTLNRETLRKLALRPLDDDQLRAVNGGRGNTQCGCAPSHDQC